MFSTEYIKMCEKAEEIQKYWRPKVLDYYCKKGNCNKEFIGYVRVANKAKKDIFRKNCYQLYEGAYQTKF